MSFLLDALRKSEDQKRRGAVPSIHGGPENAPARRMPRALNYAILVVVPLLLVLTWAVLRSGEGDVPRQAPDSVPEERVQAETPAATADRAEAAINVPTVPARPNKVQQISANRTPVENYQPPAGSNSPSRRSGSAPGKAEAIEEFAGSDAPAEGANAQSQSRPSQEPAASEAPMPGLILFWELPGSVRGQINEIHISVMVFAEQPEDRFLLMNGTRYIEGDELQPGLRIEEITREGVIFTFRHYRFLLTQ